MRDAAERHRQILSDDGFLVDAVRDAAGVTDPIVAAFAIRAVPAAPAGRRPVQAPAVPGCVRWSDPQVAFNAPGRGARGGAAHSMWRPLAVKK